MKIQKRKKKINNKTKCREESTLRPSERKLKNWTSYNYRIRKKPTTTCYCNQNNTSTVILWRWLKELKNAARNANVRLFNVHGFKLSISSEWQNYSHTTHPVTRVVYMFACSLCVVHSECIQCWLKWIETKNYSVGSVFIHRNKVKKKWKKKQTIFRLKFSIQNYDHWWYWVAYDWSV